VTNHWQLNGVDLTNGTLAGATISGANSTTLSIGNVTPGVAGVYRLIVSDPRGTVISSNVTVTVQSTAIPPSGNLVGAWLTGAASLAETSGYRPAGTHDGHGVTGTGTPSSSYGFTNDVPFGLTGQSLVLSGSAAISISNSSINELSYIDTFDGTSTNMTVAFWAKGVPSGGWNPFVSKFGESAQGWQLRRNGGLNPTWTVRGTGTTEDMQATSVFPTDGLWHHYAGTFSFDGVTGSRGLYVDGVLVASQAEIQLYNPAVSSYLTIGGRFDGNAGTFGNYFTGKLYNVRIYNIGLSEAQINSLAYSQLPPSVPAFSGPPVLSGNKLVLTWSSGSLLQSTNVAGPWAATGATSPYTNDVSTAPQMFYKLSSP